MERECEEYFDSDYVQAIIHCSAVYMMRLIESSKDINITDKDSNNIEMLCQCIHDGDLTLVESPADFNSVKYDKIEAETITMATFILRKIEKEIANWINENGFVVYRKNIDD